MAANGNCPGHSGNASAPSATFAAKRAMGPPMAARLPLFATCARGTEKLLADELTSLGAVKVRQDRGGVRFSGNLYEAMHVALWSRIAMRLLYPLGECESEGAEGLYDAAYQVPWEDYLTADTTFAVEATLKNSEHAHSGFVALKIKDAIVDRLREKLGARPDVDTKNPDFSIVAHLSKNQLSLSLDVCGESLHRRGYRVRPTVAPLKETLAAAMLRSVEYTGDEPFADPMCGSGTLGIEAALIATRRAPGLKRRFAIERWPNFAEEAKRILQDLRSQAVAEQRPAPFPIWLSDRDEEALDAAKRNVTAAGLKNEITLELQDATMRDVLAGKEPGLLLTNPPYGDRLDAGGQKGMKTFYYKLGESLGKVDGWRIGVLCGNPAFESAFHRKPDDRLTLWNGPIECTLLRYPKFRFVNFAIANGGR